jgi:hypothetical protein
MAGEIPALCDWADQWCAQQIESLWRNDQDVARSRLLAPLNWIQVDVVNVTALDLQVLTANRRRVEPRPVFSGKIGAEVALADEIVNL